MRLSWRALTRPARYDFIIASGCHDGARTHAKGTPNGRRNALPTAPPRRSRTIVDLLGVKPPGDVADDGSGARQIAETVAIIEAAAVKIQATDFQAAPPARVGSSRQWRTVQDSAFFPEQTGETGNPPA